MQRRLEIAFGVDQEIRGNDDLVVLGQAFRDLDAAIAAPAEFYRARLETPLALVEQHHLPLAAVDDGAIRHGQDRRFRSRRDFDVGIHIRPQQFVGIWQLDAYPRGPRLRVHMRVDQRDRAGENAIRIGARPHRYFLPDRYQAEIAFGDIGDHPYDLMIGDTEQNRAGCGPHAVHGGAFQNLAILRRKPWHGESHFAGAFDLGDGLFRHAEIFQPPSRSLDALAGNSAAGFCAVHRNIFGGGARQGRAVDLHQGLALVNVLAGGDVLDLFDKAFEPERNDRYPAFVEFDRSRRAHRHVQHAALDLLGTHARFLQFAES